MKFALAFVVASVCFFALYNQAYGSPTDAKKEVKEVKEMKAATASTAVKDAIKTAKEAKKSKKECEKDCGTAYNPVCVHDPANSSYKPRTFGTQCALDTHNCQSGTKLAVKSKGECPGAGGAKLS